MNPLDRQLLVDELVRDEGERLHPYTDLKGKLTIGVGRNLTDVGITHQESRSLLDHDIGAALLDLAAFSWFLKLTPVRQRAIVNLRFNVGPIGFRKFVKLIAAIDRQDYAQAAAEILDSQLAPLRADRLARMIHFQEAPR